MGGRGERDCGGPGWVLVEKEGPVARLILNRPGQHNAMPFRAFDTLVASLHEAEEDDSVKVIILKGNGPSFCAGHDLNDVGFVYGYTEHRTEDQKRKRRPALAHLHDLRHSRIRGRPADRLPAGGGGPVRTADARS